MSDPRVTALNPMRGMVQPPSQAGKTNHCPFPNCTKTNENGYCKHLVGFLIEDDVVELREAIPDHESFERCGVLTDTLKASDKIVVMRNNSREATNTRRVYREDGNAPIGSKAVEKKTVEKKKPAFVPVG